MGAHIWKGNDAWLNQHIFKVIPNDEVRKKYLYYYLLYVVSDLNLKTHGSGMVHITKTPFMNTKIPVPSLSDQDYIVAHIEELFSELDAGVETLRKTQRQLETYRQAVLKEAFENIDGTEGILEYFIINKPRNGYSPKPVAYKTKYKNLTLTSTTGGVFKENNFKYIDIDITDDSHLWVKHNDILIQRANTIDYVGTAALYTGKDNVYVYPDLMMKCHPIESVLPQFLVYQLHYQQIRGYYRDNATGTTGSMPKINQGVVCNTPIMMTTIDRQKNIIEKIESKLSIIKSVEKNIVTSLQQAEALKQSILKHAFEGKL